MIGVIGDIHGCYFTLMELLSQVRGKYGEIDFYCVGDLVDRGLYSHLVVEECIRSNIKVALGNHDCMFLYSFKYPYHPYRKIWFSNGNTDTLIAYSEIQEDFRKHIDYLDSLPLFYNTDDCFISHAGISILYADRLRNCEGWSNADWKFFLSDEMEATAGVLWNRTTLFKLNKIQVLGHTRQMEVTHNERSNALYIDTAACAGNKLSCAIIEGGKWIDTISVNTVVGDIVRGE